MINPSVVVHAVKSASEDLETHYKTLDILENNLERYILDCLARQLSPKVFKHAKERLVPINIFPRYVDKITNIYQTGVIRDIKDGTDQDNELMSWYQEQMSPNLKFHWSNKLFNACKSTLIQPYIPDGGGSPKIRVIPNDRFVVYSDDPHEPTNPTMVVLIAGKDGLGKDVYWAYDKDQFMIVKSDESIDYKAMDEMGLGDGVNPYGALPFIYVNSSPLKVMPCPDKDSIRMTEFVPMALTDLNVAAMFGAFSITHITNGSVENLTYAPNALWFLKPDDPEKDVQIGSLKPQIDYQEALALIQSELSLWLGSKGIKSQSVGQLTVESAASGIAKIIDEADTFDVRQEQTVHYGRAEKDFWNLVLHNMHPVWVARNLVENRQLASASCSVETKFAVTPAGTQRTQLIADQKEEYAAGFTTRKRAIATLNPQMTMDEVEELIHDIDEERLGGQDVGQMAADQSSATGSADAGSTRESSGSDNRANSGADQQGS